MTRIRIVLIALVGCAAAIRNIVGGGTCEQWNPDGEGTIEIPACNDWTDLSQMVNSLKAVSPDLPSKVVRLSCNSVTCTGEIPDSIADLSTLMYVVLDGTGLTGTLNPKLLNMPTLRWLILRNSRGIQDAVPSMANIGPQLGQIDLSGSGNCGLWPTNAPISSTRKAYDKSTFEGKPNLSPSGLYPNPDKTVCDGPTTSPTPPHGGPPSADGEYCTEIDEDTGNVRQFIVYPYTIDDTLTLLSVIFACVGMVASVAGIIFVYFFRNRPIIQYSQKRFLGLSCVGLFSVNVSALLGPIELISPTVGLCTVKEWLFFISLVVFICSLAFKNYRAWRVHQSTQKLRTVVITDKMLWTGISGATLVAFLLVLFDSIFFTPTPDPCLQFSCGHSNSGIVVTMYAYLLALVLATCFVAFKARDVPSVGCETSGILYTIVFTVFALILIVFVNNLDVGNANLQIWLTNFCIMWITVVALGFIVFRKAVWLKLDSDQIRGMFLAKKSDHASAFSQSAQAAQTSSRPSGHTSESRSESTANLTKDSEFNSEARPQSDFDLPVKTV